MKSSVVSEPFRESFLCGLYNSFGGCSSKFLRVFHVVFPCEMLDSSVGCSGVVVCQLSFDVF